MLMLCEKQEGNMSTFEIYYNGFLGINQNKITNHTVVESEYRDIELMKKLNFSKCS